MILAFTRGKSLRGRVERGRRKNHGGTEGTEKGREVAMRGQLLESRALLVERIAFLNLDESIECDGIALIGVDRGFTF